jgi:hypothetical protein
MAMTGGLRTGTGYGLRIGKITTAVFNGFIDEVRISNINRSNDWINMTYQMIANHASIVTYGGEENVTSNTCTCVIGANWRINMADHCNITACNNAGFDITFENGTAGDYCNITGAVVGHYNFSLGGAGAWVTGTDAGSLIYG